MRQLTKLDKKHWVAFGMALMFMAVFFWLNHRQYLVFQMGAPDADRFNQAIWNTLNGRFLYSTIKEGSILSNHFTPYMALLAPLFYLWDDVRILYLVQVIGFAIAGLLLYKIAYDKRPTLAPWFLLSYFLNPALHKVTLFELRRITLAVPYLALIAYGLHTKKRHWMLIGILFSLLTKEEVGLIVAGVGFFLLLRERDWKWGSALIIFGVMWVVVMQLWVIPALGEGSYPPIGYFAAWGSSMDEMLLNMLRDPVRVIQTMFDAASMRAIWRVLWPVALLLPFLAADYLLIIVPLVAVMLISSEPDMHSLDRWYMASLLPFLFAAIGIGLGRVPIRWGKWLTGALVGATLLGFWRFSPAPLGGKYQSYRYEYTEHHKNVWTLLTAVPDDAVVYAQNAFTIQLAHRQTIYNYPWIEIPEEEVDYLILGENHKAYPFSIPEIHWEIMNTVADPTYVIEMETNGVYLFHRDGEPLPSTPINRVADESIKLERIEVAIADEQGFFQTAKEPPLTAAAGQTIRVTLYWEALAAPEVERTVSVRLEAANGALLAQKDVQPSEGSRPTSWWQPGWYFRDVYYLTLPPDAVAGDASLNLVLYDSFSLDRVTFDNGQELLHLFEVDLIESN